MGLDTLGGVSVYDSYRCSGPPSEHHCRVPGPRRNADDRDAGWFAPVATRRRPILAAFQAASPWLALLSRRDDPRTPPRGTLAVSGARRRPGSVVVGVGRVALARWSGSGGCSTARYLHGLWFTSSASPGLTRAQKVISGDFQDRQRVPLEDHVASVAEMSGPAPAAGPQPSRAVVRVRHLGPARYGIRRLNRR